MRRVEYVNMLLDNVIPAIAVKIQRWSQCGAIYRQQDKVQPQVKEDDPLVSEADRQVCLDLHVLFRPPHDPDFHVLDLGYLRSTRTLQHEVALRIYDEFVDAVEKSFMGLQIEN